MAETKYAPSSSGYTSNNAGWSTSTSTIVQGSTATRKNYYGIWYINFASIRSKNVTYYPTRIRVRIKSHVSYSRTVRLYMGKGMPKDSFVSGTRPTPAGSTSYKEQTCAANAWVEFTITDATWLAALVNSQTTCFYINRGDSTASYWEGDGAKEETEMEVYVDWTIRAAPTPPVPELTAPVLPVLIAATDTPMPFRWSASKDTGGVFTSAQLMYEHELSNDGGATWGTTLELGAGILLSEVDLLAYWGIEDAHYYNPLCRYRVRAKSPVYGEDAIYSDWSISDLFTTDFRVAINAEIKYDQVQWQIPATDFGSAFSIKTINKMRLRGRGGVCRITPIADGVSEETVSVTLPNDTAIVEAYIYARGRVIGFQIDNGTINDNGGYDPVEIMDIEMLYEIEDE